MSDKSRTIMYHDYEQDRWFVMTGDTGCPLRCGERVELIIGEKTFSCQLELNQYGWYIIIGPISFILLPNQTYTVAI